MDEEVNLVLCRGGLRNLDRVGEWCLGVGRLEGKRTCRMDIAVLL